MGLCETDNIRHASAQQPPYRLQAGKARQAEQGASWVVVIGIACWQDKESCLRNAANNATDQQGVIRPPTMRSVLAFVKSAKDGELVISLTHHQQAISTAVGGD